MKNNEYYVEYEILQNRPGLLGEIASLMGLLKINIETINGVHENRRGILVNVPDQTSIERLESILSTMEPIKLIKIRKPTLLDRLAVRHGRYIVRNDECPHTFSFTRDELGIVVDFLAELLKDDSTKLIGIRGLPRVGKTESIVAASVCANKQWLFVSSTLLKQTIRNSLFHREYDPNNVYIIDGVVSTRSTEQHLHLIREIISRKLKTVIEHPDIFCQNTHYKINEFDTIIELRNLPNEEIINHLDPNDYGFYE